MTKLRYAGIVYFLIAMVFIPMTSMAQYNEKYRPQYHFSPLKGWVGDPDGLVFFRNQYHLFWWGHAVSSDLVHWKEMPYPMKGGDGSFHYFSGSVVVDQENTAGFGDSSMVAVYTMHINDSVPESQALSVSKDGVNFHFYKNNPVLDIGSNSFRDPQVFWHQPTGKWVMVAARPHQHEVEFYASADLKQWQYLSKFGPAGSYNNDWEVPDLFELTVDGDPSQKKWVLTIGQGPNRVQYFTGEFDGKAFYADERKEPVLWADYGTDFYAARTWRNIDDPASNRTTWMAWMGNWSYAGLVPTKWGKGFESVPRDISLKTIDGALRLVQTPVPELKILRRDSVTFSNKTIRGIKKLEAFQPAKNVYEIEASMAIGDAEVCGFNLLVGEGRKLVVAYDSKSAKLFVDRSNCTDYTGDSTFNKHFPARMVAPLKIKDGLLHLHLLVDQSSIEVFANDGAVAISALTFPSETQTGIDLFSDGESQVISFKGWNLASIWRD